jgi:glycosyltransferase involved in cell wall biosynthesis
MNIAARHIWLLSAYHTGSHAAWGEGYARHSRHVVRLITLDGRFWKWRMQGGARALAAQAAARAPHSPPPDAVPDAIVATDMVNLPAWLGFMRRRLAAATPVLLYMHENQLTYPWAAGERRDLTYAVINWQSMIAADAVAFNSAFHLESWFDELPRLLKHFPDYTYLGDIAAVRARAFVLPAAIDAPHVAPLPALPDNDPDAPLILWNQRWEYDKRPDRFFALLDRLDKAGVPFRLAVAGENFRNVPQEFVDARARFGKRMIQWGYVPTRTAYYALLQQADLVISTADHEFFGLSVLEAIAAGAFPLLPTRLSYPELVPAGLHAACLYADDDDLFAKAQARLLAPRRAPPSLQAHVRAHFTWAAVAPRYDAALEALRAVD